MAEENQQNILSSTRRSQTQPTGVVGDVDTTIVEPPDTNSQGPPGSFTDYRSPAPSEHLSSGTQESSPDLWEETQIGSGRHSKLPDPDDDIMQRYYDLHHEVNYYGTKMRVEEHDWHKHVNTEYDRLHSEITTFQRECIKKQAFNMVSKVEELFTNIVEYKQDLSTNVGSESQTQQDTILQGPRIFAGIQALSTPAINPRTTSTTNGNELFATPVGTSGTGEGGTEDLTTLTSGILDEVAEARLQVMKAMGTDTGASKPDRSQDILPKILELYTKITTTKELEPLITGVESASSLHKKSTELSERIRLLEQSVKNDASISTKFKLDVTNCLRTLDKDVKGLASRNLNLEKELATTKLSVKNLEASMSALSRWVDSIAKSNSQTAQISSQQTLNLSPILNRESVVQTVRNNKTPARPEVQLPPTSALPTPTLPTELHQGNKTPSGDSVASKCSSASDSSLLLVHETRLDRGVKQLGTVTSQVIDQSLSDDIVVDLFTNVVRDVERLAKECDDKLVSYAKLSEHSATKISIVDTATAKAYTWVSEVKNIYRSRQLHLQSSANKAFTGSLNIKKFSAQSTDTVFEFFKKFDQFTRASYTLDQKAMLLYSSYLDDKLKQELVLKSSSYQDMKEWLIKKFGRVKSIVDTKVSAIKSVKVPNESANPNIQADYLRHVYSVLASIQALPSTSSIDPNDLALYAYSHDTLCQILKHLPQNMVSVYLRKIAKKGMDHDFFQGKAAFDIAMELVQTEFTNMVTAAKLTGVSNKDNSSKDRPRRRSSGSMDSRPKVHNVDSSFRSPRGSFSDTDTQAVHHQASSRSQNKQNKGKWYDDKHTFPCPISKHDHELGTCEEFFKMTPWNRRKAAYRKLCYCCLRPYDKCGAPCKNKTNVPVRMVCQECVVTTEEKKTPSNVLLCGLKEHSKLGTDELIKECVAYVKDFNPKLMKTVIQPTANLVAVTTKCKECKHKRSECNCTSHPSYTSPVDEDADVPTINTATGDTVFVDEENIVHENPEESFYIMQMFDIRGQECLTFFDRGANQHLIDGDLAERTNLKVLNSRSTPIGVVGGGRIWTEYGMYCLNIGPTLDGYYHEIKCQGIKNITDEMPQYNLSVINKSVKESQMLDSDQVLPKYVGGGRVNLLLGIKDAYLDPFTMFVLPCGLGVYQSQLIDKFNSRICYGGPHSLFTEVNAKTGGNFNHINIFFTEMVNSYRNSLYPQLACIPMDIEEDDELPIQWPALKRNVHCIKADPELDISIYPTPITMDDMKVFDPDTTSGQNKPNISDTYTPSKNMETEETHVVASVHHSSANHTELSNEISNSSKNMGTEETCMAASVHHCSVYKAKVPISKLVKIVDEDDIDKIVNYRCPACSKCIKCLESNRTKAMSLQESIEQDIINKSINIDKDAKRVWVSYPFIKEPVEFLKKYHNGGSDNKYQATQAYKQQCRKPEPVKDGIRLAHKELVDKGFMKPLTELSADQQNLIANHPFKHYYPWSSVVKDSISTPVRLVVDPSRTGLNQILAKGENNMARIFEVVLRNRCKKDIFTSDISKLYNQLHLEDSALPYSLFLFSDELDQTKEPVTYVLTRAWYGVRPVGNQSGTSLEVLAEDNAILFPLAVEIILWDRYVDDLLTGSNNPGERELQIQQVQEVLKSGGFSLKFIAKSGEDPPETASSDGKTLKILGYKWASKIDQLSPGFTELNFNSKSRGMRKPNEIRMDIADNVEAVLASTTLTRRIIISKLSELYDPVGIWEPIKLQLKLEAIPLNGFGWDAELPIEIQNHWKERFKDFIDIPHLIVDRCVIPQNALDPNSVRLLCFSDAAVAAGGAAVYASYKISDDVYSCQLLTAKSKLLDGSIPRNELSAILIMAELAFLVKKALGSMVTEVLYFTDSTIALSWCHNVNKKLRMFVFNRVATIRRFIDWATGIEEDIPLYHIPGPENIADLLTKELQLKVMDVNAESEWQNGKSWMKSKLSEMPITKYSDISVSENEKKEITTECFIELDPSSLGSKTHSQSPKPDFGIEDSYSHCSTCSKHSKDPNPDERCYGVDTDNNHCYDCTCKVFHTSAAFAARKVRLLPEPIIPVVSFGWKKSVKIMTVLAKFVAWKIHKTHTKSKKHDIQVSLQLKCRICNQNGPSSSNTRQTRSQEKTITSDFLRKDNLYLGENFWFRFASQELQHLGIKPKALDNFIHQDGIYYYTGRLSEEFPVVSADLDINVFFDNQDFKAVLPVVHSKSQVFYSYLIFIHDYVRPHSGVELTYREVSKKMHVLCSPRNIISQVRKDCEKCKIMFKKTLELEMASHSAHRTILSPPFHAIQMDIAYKFKAKAWKNSRQTFDVYALVVVCLLSSATSILVLEGLETADVVLALERHSNRYGVPRHAYVDAGSQLVALQNAKFQLRDVDLALHDNLGMSVKVSNPKSHEERGRVEAKVKVLRSMLMKLSINTNRSMTTVSWETLFSKIANDVDNLPICKGKSSNLHDFGFEIITPNRLKLGRNNSRSLDDGFVLDGTTEVQLLEICRKYKQVWYQILLDRLHHLIPKCNKWLKTDEVTIDDIVIFVHKDSGIEKRWNWLLGKVVEVTGSSRTLTIEYFGPGKTTKLRVTRNPRQVSKIHSSDDIPVNTIEYYEKNVLKF